MNPLVTIKELACALAVSTRTIQRLIAEGLPRVKVTDKLYRYDVAKVRAWLDGRTKTQEAVH